jgi:copper/silver efflux system protein
MIKKVIEFSGQNRFLVLAIALMLGISGWISFKKIPIDAIPDLSDTQVIVFSKWDVSPDIIEDQVTYPIVTSLLGVPKIKDIRGFSTFGNSFVYVIFEDGTDIYWARSRVLEYLSKILPGLPEGVSTELGPDATGVGWVYQYALRDVSGKRSLADLRSYQDWFLRYQLQSVQGVSEVASIGGFEKQYQVEIKPNSLRAFKVTLKQVIDAIRKGNGEIGARVIEFAGTEYMVRARGYVKSREDIENIVITATKRGVPVYVKNVAHVKLGPQIRRGVADLNGEGDTVGAIVVMRFGENASDVISRVKAKIQSLEKSLPEGVEIVETYDRSDLIERSIATLIQELKLELVIVALVILIFLFHIPSSFVPIITLPMAVLVSFIPMYLMGVSANIMSLGGIAIAIGAMVDAALIVVENCYNKLEKWQQGDKAQSVPSVILEAVKEVGPASFYSLMVIAVSFLPIFVLEQQEGRLFKPLAYTKTLAMVVAAFFSITVVPALLVMVHRREKFKLKPRFLAISLNHLLVGEIVNENQHPISKILHKIYDPVVYAMIKYRKTVVVVALGLVAATVPVYLKLGSEFMPPLNEGSILYMPTTMPGISVKGAQDLLQRQDTILRSFPEVASVFGKVGRAETSTDPAPLSMVETTVVLKDQSEWRKRERWYSDLPDFTHGLFSWFLPEQLTWEELVAEMDGLMKFPGTTNAWTMPIKARLDMLSTGIRTPIGIKVYGSTSKEIERIGVSIETLLKGVPGTRSVFAERVSGGYFLDFTFNREALGRYGIAIADAQEIIRYAVGGSKVATTVEGRERYSVNVRYAPSHRSTIDDLERILIPTSMGSQIPLKEVAAITRLTGPGMIRTENGLLAGYVFVDVATSDIGSYVREAQKLVNDQLDLPAGYSLEWSGQYRSMMRVQEKLKVILPITLIIILLLVFKNTGNVIETMIITLGIPFSAIGAVWLLYLLGFNMSVAVWVGLIALVGIDAEMAVFMLLYLNLAYKKRREEGKMNSFEDLKAAIHEGAVKRLRPKMMTVLTTFFALMPILLMPVSEAGADVMKRMAAPMVGGIFSSFLLELLVYPAIFAIWKGREFRTGKA